LDARIVCSGFGGTKSMAYHIFGIFLIHIFLL
jgi:hypothetical protein